MKYARFLLVLAFLNSGCGGAGPPPTRTGELPASKSAISRELRDVLLVTIDTLRSDATGFSGAGKVDTPTLDRLASGGVACTSAHAHAVVTLPSHASILTGTYPYRHGIRDNSGFVLPREIPTLATVLKSAGYATAAFVSAFPLDRRFGLDRGFDVYDDVFAGGRRPALGLAERRGEDTVALARAWWDSHPAGRRFLWVHLFTPHFPYAPTEPFASRYREAPYYGEAALADEQLRPILAPLLEAGSSRAIVVLTSDHGESLGEHGEQTHGLFAYESTLRVPLVFWAPGILEPGRECAVARHVDIVPSVLELLGIECPDGLPGRSVLTGSASGRDEGSYFESMSAYLNRGWAPLYGRIEAGRKAVRLPIPELYDIEDDPQETRNLAPARAEELAAILSGVPEDDLAPAERQRPDAVTAARLRSLGYLSGGSSSSWGSRFDVSTDPKSLIESEHVIDAALSAYQRGNAQNAIRLFEGLIAQQPRMTVAYSHLAFFYTDLGRLDDAIRLLSGAVSLGVGNEEIRAKLALALDRAGRPDEAWTVLSGDLNSEDPETQSALGRIAAARGQPEEARRRFDRALAIDPSFPGVLVDIGILLMDRGSRGEAKQYLERALAEDPSLAEGWNALGVIHLREGAPGDAIGAWQRGLQADPRHTDALFNLALALGKNGQYEDAVGFLERYIPLVGGEEQSHAIEMLGQLRSLLGPRVNSKTSSNGLRVGSDGRAP